MSRVLRALVLTAAAALPLAAQLATPLDASVQRTIRWRNIGPANMASRVVDIEAVASNPKEFYIGYAAGGVWKTVNGGTTFRPVFEGQTTASIGDIAIAPSNPQVLYVGTGESNARNSISPGDGVYRSRDGGASWTKVGLEKSQHIGRIIVHPTNPDIVWVAAFGAAWGPSKERGLYKSTDGGANWKQVKFVNENAGFIDLQIDPRDPNTLYAASWEFRRGPWFMRSGGVGSGLWKSTDGGESWKEISGNGFPAQQKGRISISVHAADPRVVYAVVEADTAPNPTKPTGPRRVYNYPGDPGDPELYGIGLDIYPLSKSASGLYRSNDGGVSWTHVNRHNTRPFYFSLLRVDPKRPDRVYQGDNSFWFSDDGGKTQRLGAQDIHIDWHAMWIDPNDPTHWMVGGDGGIGITRDDGGSFEFIDSHATGQFYAVSFDNQPFYRVCGGLQDNGTWCGPSRTKWSEGILTRDWQTVGGGDGFYSQQDPTNPDIVYYSAQGGNYGRRDLSTWEAKSLRSGGGRPGRSRWADSLRAARGDTTAPISPEIARELDRIRKAAGDDSARTLRFNWEAPLILSAHNANTLYAGGNKVIKSVNRGDRWQEISPDLSWKDSVRIRTSTMFSGGITKDVTGAEVNGTVSTLAESPARPGLLWVGTDDGKVWVTRNDGVTWEELTARFTGVVPAKTWVSRIEASRADSNTVYIAFDNHRENDFTPYLFVSRDGGKSFTSIVNDLPRGPNGFVYVVREDPVNASLLYVGTDRGVYASVDRGTHWSALGSNFPTVPVRDLKVHPRERELIAGTHGRAIWIADVSPLQELTATVTAASAHLFSPRTAYQFAAISRMSEEGHQHFFGENPTYGAALPYWLGSDATGATLTVINTRGDTVRAFRVPATKGMHRVYWDLRAGRGVQTLAEPTFGTLGDRVRPGEAPPPDPNARRERARPGAPVAAGEYLVTLSANGVTTRQLLTVRRVGSVDVGGFDGDDQP
ncbi:MAG: hypothetical protein K2X99_06720 [Gemmatimonadaceae bacterium]|nr:hypothetical protein [Gemmatimonadaceae bacterium]